MERTNNQTPLPEGYADQRKTVVQLLKDHNNSYTLSSSPNRNTAGCSSATQEGYWNLTPVALERMTDTDDLVAQSHLTLADELDFMREGDIYYYALERVFLDTCEYNAYEDLKKRVAPHIQAFRTATKNKSYSNQIAHFKEAYWASANLRLYADLELAIQRLTLRLMHKDLRADFGRVHDGSLADLKTNRRIAMEDKYREIYRIFVYWCEEIAQEHKRYRNKAYEATTTSTGQPRSTVERAVHFCESTQKENTA